MATDGFKRHHILHGRSDRANRINSDTNEMKFSTRIKIDPIGKPRQTRADKWKQRPCVMRYRAFADELRLQCKLNGIEITDRLHCEFYIKIPQSWSKKKKELMRNKPHQQVPDIDNLCKSVLDSLLSDDSGVYRLQTSKFWADEGGIVFY